MSLSLLDSNQITQLVVDEDAEALRVVGTAAGGAINITATDPIAVTIDGQTGQDVLANYNIAYTNLTTSYYQVVASTASEYTKVVVYDTSGETIELSLGGSGSEVVKIILGPGCDQSFECQIPAASRIAVRTVGSNATAGSLILNLIGQAA
jgi:hypothetical protein